MTRFLLRRCQARVYPRRKNRIDDSGQRSRQRGKTVRIERLTPALGAELDIDLGHINAEGAQAVYDALMAHQVV